MEITDKQITDYINEHYSEMYIMRMEDELLRAFKMRQEHLPSEQNDKDWLQFTDFVIHRRCRVKKEDPLHPLERDRQEYLEKWKKLKEEG